MDAVEEIKTRLAVEDVVSEYVQLKRAGRNFKGLSPFTNEKTPSFIVSPEKQIWHDFSSGKGGDIFTFVQEVEGLDFKAALELLARRAGVELEDYRSSGGQGAVKLKERLYKAHENAAKFYQAQLKGNKRALEYLLKQREFSKDTVLDFQLGYAPNTGTALSNFLKQKGFNEQEIKKAGLVSSGRYTRDMFRGRIVVPLADPGGRIIGFTARILDASDQQYDAPKYLNTPQTMIYDKGRHVYGLHLAKESIRKNGFVVLAEGNLDVIASHQAGLKQVVATAGTALTEMQLKTLKRFTSDVRLAFDQDRAGISATERAIPIAGRVGVDLSIITIPSGKDPDELIKSEPGAWQKIVVSPQNALDWLIDRYAEELDLSTGTGKKRFTDIVLAVVRKLPDEVEQDHYVGQLARMIDADKSAIARKLSGTKNDGKKLRKRATKPDRPSGKEEQIKAGNRLLSILLMQPALRSYLNPLSGDMFEIEPAKAAYNFLVNNPKFTGEPSDIKELSPYQDYVKIVYLRYEELYQDLELLELRNEASRLQSRLIEQYVKSQKQPLIQAMKTADDSQLPELLKKAKELDKLLKKG